MLQLIDSFLSVLTVELASFDVALTASVLLFSFVLEDGVRFSAAGVPFPVEALALVTGVFLLVDVLPLVEERDTLGFEEPDFPVEDFASALDPFDVEGFPKYGVQN